MQALVTFFVRAKHWQIFLLLFGVGCVGGSAAMLLSLTAAPWSEAFTRIGLRFGSVMVVSMLCLVLWLWSIGSFLNSIGKPSLRLRMGFFRFALVYPALYVFLFAVLLGTTYPALLVLIFPLHLFAMYCQFYDLYFVSKSLVLAETGKPALFQDYAGAFFLLWFFPIGIWFLQPRINRLHAQPVLPEQDATSLDLPHQLIEPNAGTSGNGTDIQSATPFAYAGLWLRMAAALIDGLLIFFPLFFLAFFSIVVVRLVSAETRHDPAIGILVTLVSIGFLGPWFYFSFLESSRWQATVGKNILRLYVTDMEGRRLTRTRAMGRNFAKCLSNLTFGAGYLLCGFTAKKQPLHDVLARCLVLRRPMQ